MVVDDDLGALDDEAVELLEVGVDPDPSEFADFAAPSFLEAVAGVFEESTSDLLDLALLAAARLSFL
ncbi:MAG: hypothetical protein ACOYD0_11595 [Candidatus Nanopelagicales bacterium]